MSTDNIKKSLGIRLNETRKKAGKTQQEFADEANVSVVSWGEYERGNVSPNLDKLCFLHKYNISVDYLLSGKIESLPCTPEQELISVQRQTISLAHNTITRLEWDLEKLRKEMGKGNG